jgi:esterase/lipase superfamily enzyme
LIHHIIFSIEVILWAKTLFSNSLRKLYPHYCSRFTQVLDVISRKPELTKVSFLAHSVGGLAARYAIAKLYRHPDSTFDRKAEGTICGLEAVNFITVATPHLGSRGNKQVLC